MYSKIFIERNAIVIYYAVGRDRVRFYTGIKMDEWDIKRGQLKHSAENYEQRTNDLREQKKRVDDIIQKYRKDGVTISPAMLKKEINEGTNKETIKLTSNVVETYKAFVDKKMNEFIDKKKPQSGKDYVSLFNALQDYNREKNQTLLVKDLDTDFFKAFEAFLKNYRPTKKNETSYTYYDLGFDELGNPKKYETKEYQTKGGLGMKSIKKRFDCLSSFMRFLRSKEMISESQLYNVKEYKSTKNMKVPPTIKSFLELDKIYKLNEYQTINSDGTINESEERIKDLYVFACLTGIRFGDLMMISEDDIFIKDGIKYIERDASKTNEPFKVPFTTLSYQIFEKYNFKFEKISNQKANEILKKVLKKSRLFEEKTTKKSKKTGKNMLEYEILSLHRGRDSFINNLVEHTPIVSLMTYTGHKKMDTLQKYLNNKRADTKIYTELLEPKTEKEKDKKNDEERKLYEKLKAKFDK